MLFLFWCIFCVDREIINKIIGDFSFKNIEIYENSRESISVVKFKNFNIISRGINNYQKYYINYIVPFLTQLWCNLSIIHNALINFNNHYYVIKFTINN